MVARPGTDRSLVFEMTVPCAAEFLLQARPGYQELSTGSSKRSTSCEQTSWPFCSLLQWCSYQTRLEGFRILNGLPEYPTNSIQNGLPLWPCSVRLLGLIE